MNHGELFAALLPVFFVLSLLVTAPLTLAIGR
jgi:hypothetical protein